MTFRPVFAEIDLDALRANLDALRAAAPDTHFMAVVKADAYGHGAAEVARAVVEDGVECLGVALVEEAIELRHADVYRPIVILSEPPVGAVHAIVQHRLTPVVYRSPFIEALADAVLEAGASDPHPVHLKVDTGMHRAGCDPSNALALAKRIATCDQLVLEGLMTHLAVADEPEHPFTREQLDRFDAVRDELRAAGIEPSVVHAANSAAAISRPDARYDLVRCGIALYGIPPSQDLEGIVPLRPVMALRAQVSQVRRIGAGEGVSYGLRYRPDRAATIAVVPIGYGDGVPRRLYDVGAEVLVGGRRRPIAGNVTMDQLMVDCGDDEVVPGDEVVLLGRQGGEEITAAEWAARLGTIGYEVVCGVGNRVPRRYLG